MSSKEAGVLCGDAHPWSTCSHPSPLLSVWLRDGRHLPMVSKKTVHSGAAQPRICPLPGTASFPLSWGDIYLVLLPSVVLASRNQGIQSGLRSQWVAAPASAAAPARSRGASCAPMGYHSGGICYPENSGAAPKETYEESRSLVHHPAVFITQGHWVTQQGCSHRCTSTMQMCTAEDVGQAARASRNTGNARKCTHP